MAACEVTQGQWVMVMGTKPWLAQEFAEDASENAVTYVSWDDCQEFVARLNACGQREYRLPTEAECDYASRAGFDGKAMFWLADESINDYAWHLGNTVRAGEKYAHPVGKKKANPWDLFDMAGNVFEWVVDWAGVYSEEAQENPTGGEIGKSKVLRGGSYIYERSRLRTSARDAIQPAEKDSVIGFRCVVTP